MEIWILGHKWHANDWVIWRARIFGSRPLGQVPKIFWRARILFLGPVHWDRSQTCRDVFDFLNRSSSVVDIVDRRSTYSDSHDRWRFLHPRSSINISTFTMMDNSKIEYSRSVTILTSSIIGRRHRRSTFRQSQGWMMDDGWWKTDRPRSEIWMSSTSSIDTSTVTMMNDG